jgi:hypothetical protein
VEYSEREAGEAQPAPVYEQSTARFSPVTEPPPARRSQARLRPRRARAGWLPFAVAVVALAVGILAAVNVAGNLAAPETGTAATRSPATVQGTRPAAATQGGQNPQTTQIPPGGDQTAFLRIANTGGEGAFLRRTTNMDDRVRAWPDNTRLQVIGPDASTNGTQWKNVQDPAGNQGWIPAQFTRPE